MVWKQGAAVAIWGSGLNAEKVYVKYAGKYDIRIVVDNFKNKDRIFNKKIVSAEEFFGNEEYRDLKIIIASDKWKEIAEQLRNEGLYPGEDFLPYIMLDVQDIEIRQILTLCKVEEVEKFIDIMRQDRKTVIFWGNCQVDGIREFCKCNDEFCQRYFVLKFDRLWQISELLEYCDQIEVWKKCDLFICQKVAPNNKFNVKISEKYRVDYVREINKDCDIIIVPNLRFEGYYPQLTKESRVALTNIHWEGVTCMDKNIISMVAAGEKDEKIIETVEDENFYTEDEVRGYFGTCLTNFKKYESDCNIQMGDYLEQNKILYFAPYHPHADMIYELTQRLLKYLKVQNLHIKQKNIIKERINQRNYFHKCEYVYPSVLKGLGVKNFEDTYRLNIVCFNDETICGREVLERYIAICRGYGDEK